MPTLNLELGTRNKSMPIAYSCPHCGKQYSRRRSIRRPNRPLRAPAASRSRFRSPAAWRDMPMHRSRAKAGGDRHCGRRAGGLRARRYLRHRHSGGAAVAGRASGPRSGPANAGQQSTSSRSAWRCRTITTYYACFPPPSSPTPMAIRSTAAACCCLPFMEQKPLYDAVRQ